MITPPRQTSAHVLEGGILCMPGANLGGRGVLTVGGPAARLLQLDAAREQDPITVALSINAKSRGSFPAGSDHRLMGTCRWGSKAGAGEIVFDVRHGCRMTLDASHVTLDVQMLGTVVGATYVCNASIAYGSHTGPSSLTFTEQSFGLLPGNSTSLLTIPQYARRVAVFSQSNTFAGRVELFSGGVVKQVFTPSNNMVPVDITNGCEFLRFTNTDVNAVTVTPFYELVV